MEEAKTRIFKYRKITYAENNARDKIKSFVLKTAKNFPNKKSALLERMTSGILSTKPWIKYQQNELAVVNALYIKSGIFEKEKQNPENLYNKVTGQDAAMIKEGLKVCSRVGIVWTDGGKLCMTYFSKKNYRKILTIKDLKQRENTTPFNTVAISIKNIPDSPGFNTAKEKMEVDMSNGVKKLTISPQDSVDIASFFTDVCDTWVIR